MFSGIGGSEIIVILFFVLLLFGSKRIPEFSRAIGKAVHAVRKAIDEIRDEIDHPDGPPRQGSDKAG